MHTVIGPILTRDGGYAFDSWTPEEGLSRGYAYRRIEDAHYARKAEIRFRTRGYGDHMVLAALWLNSLPRWPNAKSLFMPWSLLIAITRIRSIDRFEPCEVSESYENLLRRSMRFRDMTGLRAPPQ